MSDDREKLRGIFIQSDKSYYKNTIKSLTEKVKELEEKVAQYEIANKQLLERCLSAKKQHDEDMAKKYDKVDNYWFKEWEFKENEYMGKVEQYTILESKYYKLKAEIKDLKEKWSITK